jgi:uncharacterized protein (DUF736 family)
MVPGADDEQESIMSSTIANLNKTDDGYRGTLTTLTMSAPIEIQRNTRKAKPTEPDYRVVGTKNGFELGAAWIRQSRSNGEDYVSVSLSAPELNGVMYGNIAPAPGGKDGEFVLIWNRRS